MNNTNDAGTTPQPPQANPVQVGGGEHAWIQMSLNQINSSLGEIRNDLKDTKKQLELVDRHARAAYTIAKGIPDIGGHIKDSGIFMAKTDLRLDQLSQNSVTKGQIAVWVLSATFAAILGIAAAAWWIAEKYLIPILERLPPLS